MHPNTSGNSRPPTHYGAPASSTQNDRQHRAEAPPTAIRLQPIRWKPNHILSRRAIPHGRPAHERRRRLLHSSHGGAATEVRPPRRYQPVRVVRRNHNLLRCLLTAIVVLVLLPPTQPELLKPQLRVAGDARCNAASPCACKRAPPHHSQRRLHGAELALVPHVWVELVGHHPPVLPQLVHAHAVIHPCGPARRHLPTRPRHGHVAGGARQAPPQVQPPRARVVVKRQDAEARRHKQHPDVRTRRPQQRPIRVEAAEGGHPHAPRWVLCVKRNAGGVDGQVGGAVGEGGIVGAERLHHLADVGIVFGRALVGVGRRRRAALRRWHLPAAIHAGGRRTLWRRRGCWRVRANALAFTSGGAAGRRDRLRGGGGGGEGAADARSRRWPAAAAGGGGRARRVAARRDEADEREGRVAPTKAPQAAAGATAIAQAAGADGAAAGTATVTAAAVGGALLGDGPVRAGTQGRRMVIVCRVDGHAQPRC
ncbi:hypothetical protein BU14_0021s0046 [Porphyra umbilicalis]|uniref:Uncharacterized protein n=1 Tax=Porphyra umbilicalis TaxID=2786 RepID=A0A1X6PKN5_PORUM|nr:hypothetical protein BU14_0021s0046 [Porphyra umbilicalis]|eukprot:OSX81441.1 hypothetical protein BU14_0021s0046 [Porphyra umbilicalis]